MYSILEYIYIYVCMYNVCICMHNMYMYIRIRIQYMYIHTLSIHTVYSIHILFASSLCVIKDGLLQNPPSKRAFQQEKQKLKPR